MWTIGKGGLSLDEYREKDDGYMEERISLPEEHKAVVYGHNCAQVLCARRHTRLEDVA
jgi:hypothetical protein